MFGFGSHDDYRPLFYARGHAVHLTVLLVAIHVAALVIWCLLKAGGTDLDVPLMFATSEALGRGQIWRFVTYALLHQPTLGFALEMAMLFMFGRETERFLGTKAFGWLYAGLLLITPVLLSLWSFVADAQVFAGTNLLHLGVFIAFAAIYPGAQIFFGVAAKWIAIILLAIYSLFAISRPDLRELSVLWATAGGALLGIRLAGGAGGFDFFSRFRFTNPFPKGSNSTPPGVVKPRARPRRAVEAGVGSPGGGSGKTGGSAGKVASSSAAGTAADVHESIDPLLEKISKHGLASLSTSERAQLERARASLLRKERGN